MGRRCVLAARSWRCCSHFSNTVVSVSVFGEHACGVTISYGPSALNPHTGANRRSMVASRLKWKKQSLNVGFVGVKEKLTSSEKDSK